MSKKASTGHVVSHTHWDREWRYPMWQTRLMLVDLMDELIELLESGKYPGFLLDGQVIPVLDYLDIRPEMTDRIKALVSSGKLQIGPWLTLPDKYPVDGEALVRNLLVGIRCAEKLGGATMLGYTSFGWGQTAQLPQIYDGFGIDVAMIGKRVGIKRAPNCEFIWTAPDGTELLTTRFGELGRQNFYLKIHLLALFGMDYLSDEWRYDWVNGGTAYHRADKDQMEQDHFRLDAPVKCHFESITPEEIEETWKSTRDSFLENDRLMMDGCDYAAGQPMIGRILEHINKVDADPQRQWVHTTMPEFVEVLKGKIDRSKLAVVEGELRDGPAGSSTANALSTRLYLKRRNKKAQNMLIRFAEPLTVVASLYGADDQGRLIGKAWDYLLKSHPHDSINGVTQDKTAKDVDYRLNQVIDISQTLGNRAMQELVSRIDMSGFSDEDILVAVFNPLPYPCREVLESWINLPRKKMPDVFGGAYGLQLFDAEGCPVDTQWQGCSDQDYPVAELHTRAFPYYSQRHRIFFDTGTVPACGYKVFRAVLVEKEQHIDGGVKWNNSIASTGNLLKAPDVLENEFLRVDMNPNGTFNLTDKRSGGIYKKLNYYQDCGEHGNYWVNKNPMFDQGYTSLGSTAQIWSEESGPLQATLVSEVAIDLPSRGIIGEQRRGDKLVPLTIRTSVTLRAGAGQVEVNVEFENRHEDHCLRVMFPTGLSKATHADAGGHFTVDHRPIRPQGPTQDSVWPGMATLPQNNFLDISDGQSGLAFINDSLTEYEVLDNDDRTVALTLLRAVKNWICTERVGSDFPSQKGGQCLGQHKIRYAIVPHKGNWQSANIPLVAEQFNVPSIPVQTRRHTGSLSGKEKSLFEIDNTKLRFSTLKKSSDRDTIIVRLYNPTDEKQKGYLKFSVPLANAWLTNLNEERHGNIDLTDNNYVPVAVDTQRIVTVEIKPA